jgi:hypothetical protein
VLKFEKKKICRQKVNCFSWYWNITVVEVIDKELLWSKYGVSMTNFKELNVACFDITHPFLNDDEASLG